MNTINHRKEALALMAWLRIEQIEQGLSDQTISDRTGIGRANISRMFNGNHLPRLDTYLKLKEAIKKNISD